MKIKVLFVALLLSFLQGCAFLDAFCKKDDPMIPETKVVHVDPRVLETCKPLPTLEGNQPFDILKNLEGIVLVYKDCSSKQDNSVKVIKSLSNIKE